MLVFFTCSNKLVVVTYYLTINIIKNGLGILCEVIYSLGYFITDILNVSSCLSAVIRKRADLRSNY